GRAAGDPITTALAAEVAELMDSRAHDDVYGGYLESRAVDWTEEPPDGTTVLGRPPEGKTGNTHLHVMEAFAELALVDPAAAVPRLRLPEVIVVMSLLVIDRSVSTCIDLHARDWTPVEDEPRSSYGHDLETVTLLIRACEAAGLPDRLLMPL